MKDNKKVSEVELQAALRKFVEAGGMIRKLPAEKTSGSQMVGVRWNGYEMGE